MKLKTVPCMIMAFGMLIVPASAFGQKVPHMMHPNPVPNSHHVNPT